LFSGAREPLMRNDYSALVGKVWNYAHVLCDQGIGYGDYVEQITLLLFLKMDQERAELLGEQHGLRHRRLPALGLRLRAVRGRQRG
jgi:hypothetical protein